MKFKHTIFTETQPLQIATADNNIVSRSTAIISSPAWRDFIDGFDSATDISMFAPRTAPRFQCIFLADYFISPRF